MEQQTKQWLWYGIPAAVVAAAAVALYYGRQHKLEPAAEAAKTEAIAPAAPAGSQPEHHPVEPPAGASATPLPALGASDADVQHSLAQIFGRSLENFLVPKDIVRHVVATVDNLPRRKTAVTLWPLQPTGGTLAVGGADALTLSEDNAARYAPIMTVLKNTDAKSLALLYKRFYPLFQQAYVELGYPDGYFNDRLVAVIDHLLETPEVPGPLLLKQPGVFYEFADPALEERSAGQKLLIRMGSGNAAVIKLKLRELRREIAKRPQ